MIEELLKEIGISRVYLNNLAKNSDRCYTSYYQEKSNGKKRLIDAPNIEIKAVQSWILRNILEKMSIHERANGFVRGRSIKINTRYHLNKNYIMCLDIKDFFPSIKYEKVYEIFNDHFKDNVATDILTNICTYKGRLPQGG